LIETTLLTLRKILPYFKAELVDNQDTFVIQYKNHITTPEAAFKNVPEAFITTTIMKQSP